jgi:uncharacterized protein YjbI with pentapeptide repeats
MTEQGSAAQPLEVVSGTVVGVLDAGGRDRPWRGLVAVSGSTKGAMLMSLWEPPAGVGVGDDLHVVGRRRASGTPGVPDEIVVETRDAEARVSAAVGNPAAALDSSGVPGTSQATILASPVVRSILDVSARGLLKADSAPGLVSVSRPRKSQDPAIAWAIKRFSEPDVAPLRPSVTLVVEPTAMVGQSDKAQRKGGLSRLRGIFDSLSTVERPNGPMSKDDWMAIRPGYLTEKNWKEIVDKFLDTDSPVSCGTEHGSFILPYDVTGTGASFAEGLFAWPPYARPIPKETIPPKERAKLTAAHEFAHSCQSRLSIPVPVGRKTTAESTNALECHADATAIMLYLLDDGDPVAAETWSRQRAVAFFGVGPTHMTGTACLEAFKEAESLWKEHGGKVPTRAVIERAVEITRKCGLSSVDDIDKLHNRMDRLLPEWRRADPVHIALAARRAYIAVVDELADPKGIYAQMEAAIEALPKTAWTHAQIADPSIRGEIEKTLVRDMQETAKACRDDGVPELGAAALMKRATEFKKWSHELTSPAALDASLLAVLGMPVPETMLGKAADRIQRFLSAAQTALVDAVRAELASFGVTKSPKAIAMAYAPKFADTVVKAETKLREALAASASRLDRPQLVTSLANADGMDMSGLFARTALERLRDAASTCMSEPSEDGARQLDVLMASLLVDETARTEATRIAGQALDALRVALDNFVAGDPSSGGEWNATLTKAAQKEEIRLLGETMMKAVQKEEIRLHGLWRSGIPEGRRLDWSGRRIVADDFTGADFSGAGLSRVDFRNCTLRGADFTRACLSWARFDGADLSAAILEDADLTAANLSKSALRGASLKRAVLVEADLRWIDPGRGGQRADFSGCDLTFAKTDRPIESYAGATAARPEAAPPPEPGAAPARVA